MFEVVATVITIVLGIPSGIFGYKKLIEWKRSKSDKSPSRWGHMRDVKIPHKIKIGSWSEVSAVYDGSVESGFFDLKITDSHGTYQWFVNKSNIEEKNLGTDGYVETGKLNFTNETCEGTWKFRPDPPLKPGKAKAEIGMFEDKDFVGTDGKIVSNRPHIDILEKEVILY